MRIKDEFIIKNIDGQNIVSVKNNKDYILRDTIVLTDTALFLWDLLKNKDVTKTDMLNALLENFDISTVLALGNIDVFLRTMKENGIIEE